MALSPEKFEAFLDSRQGDVRALRSALAELAVMDSAAAFTAGLALLVIPHAHNRAVHALLLHRVKDICLSSTWARNRPQYCKIPDRIVARIMGDNSMVTRERIALAFDGLEEYVLAQADCALADLQEHGEAACFAHYFFSPARDHMQSQYAAAEVRSVFILQQYKESIENYAALQSTHDRVCASHALALKTLAGDLRQHAEAEARVAELEAELAARPAAPETLEAEGRVAVLEAVVLALAAEKAAELGASETRLADEMRRHETTATEMGNVRRRRDECRRALVVEQRASAVLCAERDALAAELGRRGPGGAEAELLRGELLAAQQLMQRVALERDAGAAELSGAYGRQHELQARQRELETDIQTNLGVTVRALGEVGRLQDALGAVVGACNRFAGPHATRIAGAVRALWARAEVRARRLQRSQDARRERSACVVQRAWRAMRGREKRLLCELVARNGFLDTLQAEIIGARNENSEAAVEEFHRLLAPLEESDKRTIALAALLIGTKGPQAGSGVLFGPRLGAVWACLRVLWLADVSPEMRLAFERFISEYAVTMQPLTAAELATIPFARPSSRLHFDLLQRQMRSGPAHSISCGVRLLPWLRDTRVVRYSVCSNPACRSKVHHTVNRPLGYSVVCCECEAVPYCSLRCLKRDREAHKGECYVMYIKQLVAKLEGHGFSPTTTVRIVVGNECLVSLGAAHILGCRCRECFGASAEVRA